MLVVRPVQACFILKANVLLQVQNADMCFTIYSWNKYMCMRNSSTLRRLAQCLASVTTEKENNGTLFILQKLVLIHDNMSGVDVCNDH